LASLSSFLGVYVLKELQGYKIKSNESDFGWDMRYKIHPTAYELKLDTAKVSNSIAFSCEEREIVEKILKYSF